MSGPRAASGGRRISRRPCEHASLMQNRAGGTVSSPVPRFQGAAGKALVVQAIAQVDEDARSLDSSSSAIWASTATFSSSAAAYWSNAADIAA